MAGIENQINMSASDDVQQSNGGIPSRLVSAAGEGGRQALSSAVSGARAGARLAVGTLFAGANVMLDLGVRMARRLPVDGRAIGARLATPEGEIEVDVLSSSPLPTEPLGWWMPDGESPATDIDDFVQALARTSRPVYVVHAPGGLAVANAGRAVLGADAAAGEAYPLLAYAPAIQPSALGDVSFCRDLNIRYAYAAGAMANGIASEALVEAMAREGFLAFFGSAGLSLDRVATAIDRLQNSLGERTFGFNLIHSPNEPALEIGVVDLYLRRGVRLVDASAYLDLTLPLIKYRVSGIERGPDGRPVCRNHVIGKVSRTEVARKFLAPPPEGMLNQLVAARHITDEQARLARQIPVAADLTVEADSGGHTDNRPAVALIPGMIALRDEMQAQFGYAQPLRIGAAGGIATPASVAAAFAMGAAYVMNGSINQAAVESGSSDVVRDMLAQAGQADVAMAPAADMFEMGVKVQVLKWGTMFSVRARKLYDLYRAHDSLEALPAAQRAILERDFFRTSLDQAWTQTRTYFEARDPSQIERAERDAKHKMALVFRSYLGQSSHWANAGEPSRKVDYQIWCGPAMGAFNEWTAGTFLAEPKNRRVADIALNLMHGAAVLTRANWLRTQGVELPPQASHVRPKTRNELALLLG